MSISTASNWVWNFLIAFFTPFITGAIDFRYGYVFAACCLTAAITVYFFLLETQRKTLEEIDTMYILGVKPWKSSKYMPEERQDMVNTDATPGARDIDKGRERESDGGSDGVRQEHVV